MEASPLSAYRLRVRGRWGLLLGYAGYTEREIREDARGLEQGV